MAPRRVVVRTQEDSHRVWSIIRLFYESLVLYRREYQSYDEKVRVHARERNTPRETLRLSTLELAALLDFKNLETLRDRQIFELKDLCHAQFRTEDSTDILDRYVSEIFHEISILKEEHYTLKTYGVLWDRDRAETELQHIVDDAHEVFPRKLAHIDFLFGKSFKRLQELLPSLATSPIVVRSLFLWRDETFIREAYPDGLHDFYRFLYRLGPLEGYYRVGLSFEQSYFRDAAIDAYGRAEPHFEEAARLYACWCESSGAEGGLVGPSAGGSGASGESAGAFRRAPREPEVLVRSIRAKLKKLQKLADARAAAIGNLSTRASTRGESGRSTEIQKDAGRPAS